MKAKFKKLIMAAKKYLKEQSQHAAWIESTIQEQKAYQRHHFMGIKWNI